MFSNLNKFAIFQRKGSANFGLSNTAVPHPAAYCSHDHFSFRGQRSAEFVSAGHRTTADRKCGVAGPTPRPLIRPQVRCVVGGGKG